MVPGFVKNAFINQVLKHVLDGNKGSNFLTAIVTPLLLAGIDWDKAIRGFQFQDQAAAMESAKLVGIVILAIWGYFIGKKKSAAPAGG